MQICHQVGFIRCQRYCQWQQVSVLILFLILIEFRDDVQQVITLQNSVSQLMMNFCEEPLPQWGNCPADAKAYAFVKDSSGCKAIKEDDDKADTVSVEITDENKNVTGLELNYYSSDDTSLKVQIACDFTKDGPLKQGDVTYKIDGQTNLVTLSHKAGCPTFQYSMLEKFFD